MPEYFEFGDVTLLKSAIIGIGKESAGSPGIIKSVVAYTTGGPVVLARFPNEQSQLAAYGKALKQWKGE